jgi:hypothetical protein
MSKETINLNPDELKDLWNGVYFKGNTYELKGELYEQVDVIDKSKYSDGPSWDYIIQRKSDGKYFKLNVWDAGEYNGYLFEDGCIEEVTQHKKTINTYK